MLESTARTREEIFEVYFFQEFVFMASEKFMRNWFVSTGSFHAIFSLFGFLLIIFCQIMKDKIEKNMIETWIIWADLKVKCKTQNGPRISATDLF